MLISVGNPVFETLVISALILWALIVFRRDKKTSLLFPKEVSGELKGVAILAVVFSHIGYFLATDHRFLFPLSIFAGVGVDLFLFLSGFGLTASALQKGISIKTFYKKSFPKLYVPLWLSLTLFFTLSAIVLKIYFSWHSIAFSAAGIFGSAELYHDINSPLWYLTPILFYYVLFPVIFSKKRPWLSALVLASISYFIVKTGPLLFQNVLHLYALHYLAFPIGMITAFLFQKYTDLFLRIRNFIQTKKFLHYSILIILISLISYTGYFSGVGKAPFTEQIISLVTMLSFVCLFLFKKIEFRLLAVLGLYSYEIYLLHWPILYHYDIFYKAFSGWLATALYIFLFIALGYLLSKTSKYILERRSVKTTE